MNSLTGDLDRRRLLRLMFSRLLRRCDISLLSRGNRLRSDLKPFDTQRTGIHAASRFGRWLPPHASPDSSDQPPLGHSHDNSQIYKQGFSDENMKGPEMEVKTGIQGIQVSIDPGLLLQRLIYCPRRGRFIYSTLS